LGLKTHVFRLRYVDMPGVVHITQASPEKPFLSLSIALDRHIITQLAAELPAASDDSNTAGKAAVHITDIAEMGINNTENK
jgi:hypothetical protein